VYSSVGEKFRGRFPWLGTSLVLTACASVAVLFGEDLIRERPVLAFLMPVIAALVGNAGHQALAVTLRGIVLDEIRPDHVLPLVLREASVGFINGAALGVLLFLALSAMSVWVDSASWQVGAVAGFATMIAMGVGTLAGSCIPLIMRRVGVDPAHASAILLIMVTDGMAFTVLLGLTFLLLREIS
jgi:magnesium transporter